jgi:hypothetical protein
LSTLRTARNAAGIEFGCREKRRCPLAASIVVKLKKNTSVSDLFEGEVKMNFTKIGDDTKGELTTKEDTSIKIAYKVQGDSVTFTVTEAPKMFNDNDLKAGLKEFFG